MRFWQFTYPPSALLITILVMGITYARYVTNPIVFDDHNFFSNLSVFSFAENPFSPFTRTLPYFSIGLLHVLSMGDLSWNRWFNIALFALTITALYYFLVRSVARLFTPSTADLRWAALSTSLWFALNPVAVYAVGYLIQRSILMATLFSIVAANLYLRAQQQNRNVDILSASLFGSLSMMSKEHAVLLPIAIIALTPLVQDWNRKIAWRAIAFVLILAPVCYWTISHRGDIVGTSYEIYSGEVLSQFPPPLLFDFPGGAWAMSIATQLGLFLKYAFVWLAPSPSFLSADLRINFASYWQDVWGVTGCLATVSLAISALAISFKKNASPIAKTLAATFLYAAVLYSVELTVVRVQEPFVLYRSFLWAPAYALLFCCFLLWYSRHLQKYTRNIQRAFYVAIPLACLCLIPWTLERLQSFSSEEALWRDALQKLPSASTAGADRIYYNLAGEAYKAKRYTEALQFSNRVISQNPHAFQGYLAKGTSMLALADTDGASRAFDEASTHPSPPEFRGYIEFKRCIVLQVRGETTALPECLKRSAGLGYQPAAILLQMMELHPG